MTPPVASARAVGRLPVHDVVVLAGGTARRLGGVSKPDVEVAGRALLDHVLDAAREARRVVVVGPPELARPGVPTTLEHPPSGGPVAGVEAGLTALAGPLGDPAPVVLVLACDVPRAALAVPAVLGALADRPEADGAHLVDPDGHPQLVAAYRTASLRAALDGLVADGGVHGVSVRRLAERLVMVEVPDPERMGADADTWDDVRDLDALISRGTTVSEQSAGGPGSELHQWVLSTAQHLGVDPDAIDVDLLLDLARDVAHQVARPAVPLTLFLAGYAVGKGSGDRHALDRVVEEVSVLAEEWDGHGAVTDEDV